MANLAEKVNAFVQDKKIHDEFKVSRAEFIQDGVYRLTVLEQKDQSEPIRLGMRMAVSVGVQPKYGGKPQHGNVVPYTFNDGTTQVVVQLFYERSLPQEDFDFTK